MSDLTDRLAEIRKKYKDDFKVSKECPGCGDLAKANADCADKDKRIQQQVFETTKVMCELETAEAKLSQVLGVLEQVYQVCAKDKGLDMKDTTRLYCAARDALQGTTGVGGVVDDGAALIAQERQRQLEKEGWSQERDIKEHPNGELALAAVCYTIPPERRKPSYLVSFWHWSAKWWKPSPDDRIRELVKAGALIAAEIDRLQTLTQYKGGGAE